MKIGGKTINSLVTLIIIAIITHGNCTCTQTDSIMGCLACNGTTNVLVLNSSSGQKTCSAVSNCLTIDSSGQCISCVNGKTLNITNGSSNCNSFLAGCKQIIGTSCLQCYDTNYYLDTSTGQCVLSIIDYCWQADASQCIECSDQNILTKNSCSIPISYCANFDYQVWQCLTCPNTSYTLHPSGVYCYVPVSNCMLYQLSSCIQCNYGYYLSNGSCLEGYTTNLEYQLLPTTYFLTTTSASTYSNSIFSICLNNNFQFSNNLCTAVTSGISYCLAANNSICIQCLPAFYLKSDNTCRPCSVYSNCLTCDAYNCKQCSPSYYLAVDLGLNTITQFFNNSQISQSSISQCLPCSILGCQYCRNDFNDDNINKILCDQCLFGYKLYNYSCYHCSDGLYFSLTTKQCTSCSILNCQYCNSNPNSCDQCLSGYWFNTTSNTCSNLTVFLQAPILNKDNVFEVLNKSLPYSSTYIINNQILLTTSCYDSSNGYTCFCSSTNTTITYSSLCYPINTNLTTATLTSTALFNYPNFSLTKTLFLNNLRTVQLLSQLPQFQFVQTQLNSVLLSPDEFATYLQIKTNYIRNHLTTMSTHALSIGTIAINQMANVFSPYKSTVLAGPGYYFKYVPTNVQINDNSFVSVSSNTNTQIAILVFFNKVQSSLDITGTTYIFTGSLTTSSSVTLKIKKINFLGSNQAYQVNINGAAQTLTVTSDTEGYLTLSNVPTSTSTTQYSIYVTSSSTTSAGDIYSSQRIENIIYRDAFIYILIVIGLYLIFLPMCALVDCVDNKSSRRRITREEQNSYQGIRHKTESAENQNSSKEQKILNINYKDFFPIYNIANTERPKRLLKLCLFIVNLQHSVTFLSLIYFHLAGGQPLAAVLLAIPAYICCIIMGYICGAIVVNLPGKTKYLINLLTIVYWIIWIAVMGSFYSNDYKPYVYTFAIIFFVLDLVFDLLETLLMYFTIKQDTRQIKLFRALSKWFSYRGFYQFNEMARDLAQARQNQ